MKITVPFNLFISQSPLLNCCFHELSYMIIIVCGIIFHKNIPFVAFAAWSYLNDYYDYMQE